MFARTRSSLACTQEIAPRLHEEIASLARKERASLARKRRWNVQSSDYSTRDTRTSTQQTLCATRVGRPSDGTPFQTQRSRARYRHKLLPPRRRRSFSDPTAHINPNHVGGPNTSVHHPMACIRGQPARRSPAPCWHTSDRVRKNNLPLCRRYSERNGTRTWGPVPACSYAHAAAGYQQQHCPMRH